VRLARDRPRPRLRPARLAPEAPPQQWQADTSSQAFKDRYSLAKGRAVDWLKGQLKREGLDGKLKVTDEDATKGLIDQVAGGKLP